MKQNTDKTIALYYRTAHQSIEPHLDNQMQKLLCYAKESRLKSYALYADERIMTAVNATNQRYF